MHEQIRKTQRFKLKTNKQKKKERDKACIY